MTDKEKLVELIKLSDACLCDLCGEAGRSDIVAGVIVDNLIAHGVTVQDVPDTNAGKWIPVEERLPDLIPSNAGTGYSEAVNVLTSGRKVLTAIWDGTDFIADADFWDAADEPITHWTPVPLPLPTKGRDDYVPTNADRIRAMSDEELAAFLECFGCCHYCAEHEWLGNEARFFQGEKCDERCEQHLLEWLQQQPARRNNHG